MDELIADKAYCRENRQHREHGLTFAENDEDECHEGTCDEGGSCLGCQIQHEILPDGHGDGAVLEAGHGLDVTGEVAVAVEDRTHDEDGAVEEHTQHNCQRGQSRDLGGDGRIAAVAGGFDKLIKARVVFV